VSSIDSEPLNADLRSKVKVIYVKQMCECYNGQRNTFNSVLSCRNFSVCPSNGKCDL